MTTPAGTVDTGTLGTGTARADGAAPFTVRLENFEGPFDLLLSLIARRQLDVTEVALSQVTDEFLAVLRDGGGRLDLGRVTEFLVVAATLLDLKAARLLPAADVEDEEDLALLEARDLLFARLLQYRAYKAAAAHLAELEQRAGRRHARSAELDPRFVGILPPVEIGVSPERLAVLAARSMTPRPVPVVGTDHVHAPRVSVREHMAAMREHLVVARRASFRELVAECDGTLEVVARFLGLLELYREGLVLFEQVSALAELQVSWVGGGGADHDAEDHAAENRDAEDRDADEEYA